MSRTVVNTLQHEAHALRVQNPQDPEVESDFQSKEKKRKQQELESRIG